MGCVWCAAIEGLARGVVSWPEEEPCRLVKKRSDMASKDGEQAAWSGVADEVGV
jgi:hypothetical protein